LKLPRDVFQPDYSAIHIHNHFMNRAIYGNVKELSPIDAPPPLWI